jgi:hypothetical protein
MPLLPPLPTYNSFRTLGSMTNIVGNRRRSRSWVDEDAMHGPKMGDRARESWFLSESSTFDGLGMGGPTMPAIEAAGRVVHAMTPAPGEQTRDIGRSGEDGEEQQLAVKKRQGRNSLQGSKTAPSLATGDEDESHQRGRVRVPAQAHVRTCATYTDLRDILRSTEQRLRDGTSQSPTKTPRSSPTRGHRGGSPTKMTPGSGRSGSSRGVATPSYHSARSNRSTPSPTKRGRGQEQQQQQQQYHHQQQQQQPQEYGEFGEMTPRLRVRNASITSIGSVANSLLLEAAEELDLSSGASSPTRRSEKQWAGQASQHSSPQHQGKRSQQASPQYQKQQHKQQQQYSPQRQQQQQQQQQAPQPAERQAQTAAEPFAPKAIFGRERRVEFSLNAL